MSHTQIQGINVAVFQADARTHANSDRKTLLADLTMKARQSGLRVQKSALAYNNYGNVEFLGTPDLVQFLANGGFYRLRWTHEIDA